MSNRFHSFGAASTKNKQINVFVCLAAGYVPWNGSFWFLIGVHFPHRRCGRPSYVFVCLLRNFSMQNYFVFSDAQAHGLATPKIAVRLRQIFLIAKFDSDSMHEKWEFSIFQWVPCEFGEPNNYFPRPKIIICRSERQKMGYVVWRECCIFPAYTRQEMDRFTWARKTLSRITLERIELGEKSVFREK